MITAFQIDGSIHCVETSPHATSRPVRAFPQGRIFLTMSGISDASILEANPAHVWMFGTEICSDQANTFAQKFRIKPLPGDCSVFVRTNGCNPCHPIKQSRVSSQLWSVKESILKTDGKGMLIPLGDVDTSDILPRTSF